MRRAKRRMTRNSKAGGANARAPHSALRCASLRKTTTLCAYLLLLRTSPRIFIARIFAVA